MPGNVPSKRPKIAPATPKAASTIKKGTGAKGIVKNKASPNVTLRKKGQNMISTLEIDTSVEENRMNTFREIDLETVKLRGTIDRCTDVISDIGQSMEEMKVSLAEVATAQTELNEEFKTLRKSQ